MAFRKPLWDPAGRKRRARELQALTRCWPFEASDTSIGGRARIIHLLADAERVQRDTQAKLPAHYDADWHTRILAALAREREALAALTRGLPADHPAFQMRLV